MLVNCFVTHVPIGVSMSFIYHSTKLFNHMHHNLLSIHSYKILLFSSLLLLSVQYCLLLCLKIYLQILCTWLLWVGIRFVRFWFFSHIIVYSPPMIDLVHILSVSCGIWEHYCIWLKSCFINVWDFNWFPKSILLYFIKPLYFRFCFLHLMDYLRY